MANIKEIVLKKKIDGILCSLMIKTNVNLVQYDDETTLATKLQTMLADIADSKGKLAELLGGSEAGSITSQIETAVNDAIEAINDDSDPTSLAGKIKAINDASTGILATAKTYTDNKIGELGVFTTVKEYVDNVKTELSSSISGAFHFKGIVNYVADLGDIEAPSAGDVYQVIYRGTEGEEILNAEYAYTGTEFIELGSIINLTAYSTTEQVLAAISSSVETAKSELEGKITSVENIATARARFIVASEVPEDLTENDIFAQIINE